MAGIKDITRRAAILGGLGGAGYLIARADSLTLSPGFAQVAGAVEDWTMTAQRA